MANDEQDQIPDFEPEGDFTEFEEEKTEASLSATIKNSPLIKLGLIAAGLIVVVGGIMLLGGKEEAQKNSNTGRASDLKETPGTAELSPIMKDAMDEYNEQNLTEAINTGNSVMPIPTEPPKSFLPAPTDATANEDPLQRWRQMQEERLRVQREQEQMQTQMAAGAQADPAVQQAIDSLSQAMVAQMTRILGENSQRKVSSMVVTTINKTKAEDKGTTAQPGVMYNPDGTPITPKVPLEVVIPAGSIVYAQLLNEANSDVTGPIVALLAQGPFSGSRVLGSFAKQEELLTMSFKVLVSKEGFSVPINAIAMDPETTLTGMATDVDHRYWRRVILPAAAQFVQGVGEAIAKEGTTTVEVTGATGTTATTDNSGIDTKQELAQGAEKAFQKVSEIIDDEGASVEVLVVVKAGTPLGLLFLESLTKQTIEQARYGTPTNADQQQREQEQSGNPLLGLVGLRPNGQQNQNGYDGILQSLQAQQGVQDGTNDPYMNSGTAPAQ